MDSSTWHRFLRIDDANTRTLQNLHGNNKQISPFWGSSVAIFVSVLGLKNHGGIKEKNLKLMDMSLVSDTNLVCWPFTLFVLNHK